MSDSGDRSPWGPPGQSAGVGCGHGQTTRARTCGLCSGTSNWRADPAWEGGIRDGEAQGRILRSPQYSRESFWIVASIGFCFGFFSSIPVVLIAPRGGWEDTIPGVPKSAVDRRGGIARSTADSLNRTHGGEPSVGREAEAGWLGASSGCVGWGKSGLGEGWAGACDRLRALSGTCNNLRLVPECHPHEN